MRQEIYLGNEDGVCDTMLYTITQDPVMFHIRKGNGLEWANPKLKLQGVVCLEMSDFCPGPE